MLLERTRKFSLFYLIIEEFWYYGIWNNNQNLINQVKKIDVFCCEYYLNIFLTLYHFMFVFWLNWNKILLLLGTGYWIQIISGLVSHVLIQNKQVPKFGTVIPSDWTVLNGGKMTKLFNRKSLYYKIIRISGKNVTISMCIT